MFRSCVISRAHSSCSQSFQRYIRRIPSYVVSCPWKLISDSDLTGDPESRMLNLTDCLNSSITHASKHFPIYFLFRWAISIRPYIHVKPEQDTIFWMRYIKFQCAIFSGDVKGLKTVKSPLMLIMPYKLYTSCSGFVNIIFITCNSTSAAACQIWKLYVAPDRLSNGAYVSYYNTVWVRQNVRLMSEFDLPQ